jgi:hypothetical protein
MLHSSTDPVSDYVTVARRVIAAQAPQLKLVSFHGLKHFLHLDLSAHAVRDAALAHFAGHGTPVVPGDAVLAEYIHEREEEIRSWSNLVWLVLAGFLAVAGVLVHETAATVRAGGTEAAFILVAYSALISAYLQQFLLYLFYLNRTQAYVRQFVEPYYRTAAGFATYRLNRWMSGAQSRFTTPFVTTSAGVLPILANVWCLATVYTKHRHELSWDAYSGVLLTTLLALASLWLLAVMWLCRRTFIHSSLHLRFVPSFLPASAAFTEAVTRMYGSVSPGVNGVRPTGPADQK